MQSGGRGGKREQGDPSRKHGGTTGVLGKSEKQDLIGSLPYGTEARFSAWAYLQQRVSSGQGRKGGRTASRDLGPTPEGPNARKSWSADARRGGACATLGNAVAALVPAGSREQRAESRTCNAGGIG